MPNTLFVLCLVGWCSSVLKRANFENMVNKISLLETYNDKKNKGVFFLKRRIELLVLRCLSWFHIFVYKILFSSTFLFLFTPDLLYISTIKILKTIYFLLDTLSGTMDTINRCSSLRRKTQLVIIG